LAGAVRRGARLSRKESLGPSPNFDSSFKRVLATQAKSARDVDGSGANHAGAIRGSRPITSGESFGLGPGISSRWFRHIPPMHQAPAIFAECGVIVERKEIRYQLATRCRYREPGRRVPASAIISESPFEVFQGRSSSARRIGSLGMTAA
jgi:hypothetical protein